MGGNRYELDNRSGMHTGSAGCFRNIHCRGSSHHRRELSDGLTCQSFGKEYRKMETQANEVMYKMAEFLLKKMQENGLISAEEREKITVLNIETFSPELAEVYL